VLVNGGAQGADFRPKRTQNEPNYAILVLKTSPFRAKWDAQKSVNYVWAAGINEARPFAGAAAQAMRHNKLLIYSLIWVLRNKTNFHRILRKSAG
jgi:hypothetical protein